MSACYPHNGPFASELTRRHILGRLSALLAFSCAPVSLVASQTAVAATSPQGATEFVQWLAGQALQVLRSPDATMTDRETVLRQLLAKGFDLAFIGRFVLGRSWRRMSPDQQSTWLQVYSVFFLNTYSARFGGYGGQTFTVTSAEDQVPFDKYANAALGLAKPSSAARALLAGSVNIERADFIVQTIAAQKGMQNDSVDETVAAVNGWLAANREKS